MTSVTSIRRLRPIVLAGILAVGLAGCAAPDAGSTPTPTARSTAWSYDGADGPEHWDDVATACADNSDAHESPIDIVTAQLNHDAGVAPVQLDYQPTPFELENNGHTVEAVPEDLTADSIVLDGKTYYLQQFHFHASSEHTIDGVRAAAELHLVHKAPSGEVAVLGVLIAKGDGSTALDQLFDSIPTTKTLEGAETVLSTPIDPSALLPASDLSARYAGSLTTPPCTEGVSWNVFLSPITVSDAQLAAYTSVYPENHRPTQPLHGRTVTEVGAE